MQMRRWPVLLAVHGVTMVVAMWILWRSAQPVAPSPLGLALSWPYTLSVTLMPGVVVGLVEGALLRSPRGPVAGYVAMVCFSGAALWLPLVMLTFADDVPPNTTWPAARRFYDSSRL